MTIGIDANWLIYENAGIGKYSYNLILEILKNDHQNRYILMANFIRHFRKRKQILNELVKKSGNKIPAVKILVRGTIDKKLNVRGCAMSEGAKTAIEKLGGTVK